MMEKLQHIISGDDTNGNVAGGNHFGDVCRREDTKKNFRIFVDEGSGSLCSLVWLQQNQSPDLAWELVC